MAITLSPPTSDNRLVCASTSRAANLTAATVLAWVRVATADGRIWQRGSFASGPLRALSFVTANGGGVYYQDSQSTPGESWADTSAFAAWGTSRWLLVACTNDDNGSASDRKLFMGSLLLPAAEPSSYQYQILGTGGVADDSSTADQFGGDDHWHAGLGGQLGPCAKFNRVLSLQEIRDWQVNPARVRRGLVLYLAPRTVDGVTVDRSGYGHHASIVSSGASATTERDPVRIIAPERRVRLAAGRYILAQRAVPTSVVSIGGWSDEGGGTTNIHQKVDEGYPPNDADYVRSGTAPSEDTLELALGSLSAPEDGAVRIRVRYGTV